MQWIVQSQNKQVLIELPDRIPANQIFSATIAGKSLQARWLPQLRALCIVDEHGAESLYKARMSQFQRFAGEADTKCQLEYMGGKARAPQFLDATLTRHAPGQGARGKSAGSAENTVRSPMAGKVLKVFVKAGDKVEAGQPLVIVEAMKMENRIFAPLTGTIKGLKVKEQDQVTAGQPLLTIT